jgi:hypothetical protein
MKFKIRVKFKKLKTRVLESWLATFEKAMQKKINHTLYRLIELMRKKTKTHFQGI